MSLVRVHSENLLNQSARAQLPTGIFRGIYFYAEGQNQTGQAITPGNLGTIRVLKDGKEKHNISFERLQDIDDIFFGAPVESGTSGSAFDYNAFLPFHLPNDDDTGLIVRPGDRLEVLWDFPEVTSTIISSGNAVIYAVMAPQTAVTPYELQFRSHNITIGGSGTVTQLLKAENVHTLFYENDTTILNNFSVKQDGNLVYSSIPREHGLYFSQLYFRLETLSSVRPLIAVPLSYGTDVAGAVADTVEVEINASGAGQIDIVLLSVFPTVKKLTASIQQREQAVDEKLNKKAQRGNDAAVQFLASEKVGE